MKVFIVVPNWNGADMLANCLQSLRKQSYQSEIIVVDNASTNSSLQLISSRFSDVTVISDKTNLGFAGGVNVGIRYALEKGADAVALFNNDAVAEKDWLENLIRNLKKDSSAGIVTCKLMRDDKLHFDSTGDFYTKWGIPFPRGRNQKDKGQYSKPESIFGASGGASLYRSEMLKEIGLFDESFFAYYEDVDISFRAQLAGWKVLYEPSATAYHYIGATSSKLGSFTRYHSTKNFLLLYTKNMPAILYWKYLPLFLLQLARFAVSSTLKGGLIAYLKGVFMFLILLPKTLILRRSIQSKRKLTASQIDELLIHARPPKIPSI